MIKTFTAIISERASPFPPVSPWPLIYTLENVDPQDKKAITREIAVIRYTELCDGAPEDDEEGVIAEIAEGIEVHFTFDGDLLAVSDFRE